MRTNKLILCALAAITAVATACSNEELASIDSPQKGIVIEATAGTPTEEANTRIAHADNSNATGGSMNITWAAGDGFTAYTSTGNKATYTIKDGDVGKKSASFTATWNNEPASGSVVYAIYPRQATDNPAAIPLSLKGQTGTLAGLRDFNYMTSSATYQSGQSLSFSFTHQVAIVKLVMTFPDGVSGDASNVGLSAGGLNKSVTLNLTDGGFSKPQPGDVTTNDPIDIVDQKLTAYLCVFGGELTNAKAIATVDNVHYEADLVNLTIVASNMYTATVALKPNFIVMGNLKVAVGNLVTDGPNGAKIGAPTDYGLYFQFGSLIGWSTEEPLFMTVKPTDYTGSTSWDSSWTGNPATDDASTGKGDPCRYYLKETWRLPTKAEYETLFNSATNWDNSGGWSWTDNSAKHPNGLIFPASGYRFYSDGTVYNVDGQGGYWSASPIDNNIGHLITFAASSMVANNNSAKSFGYPVRCVQPATN